MSVSIIMPAFHAQTFIVQAVQSVLQQTHQNWELTIIADDGIDYAKFLYDQNISDPRIEHISTAKNASGAAAARNMGLSIAQGKIIALLDADDVFHPQKLEIMMPLAQQHGLVSCAMLLTDQTLNPLRTIAENAPQGIHETQHYKNINFSGDTMIVFDRSKHSHFYNPNLKLLEDLDFTIQCLQNQNTFYHCPQPLHTYRKVKHSLSNTLDAKQAFLDQKQKMLSDIKNNPLKCAKLQQNLSAFLSASLNAEQTFNADQDILFEDHLERLL